MQLPRETMTLLLTYPVIGSKQNPNSCEGAGEVFFVGLLGSGEAAFADACVEVGLEPLLDERSIARRCQLSLHVVSTEISRVCAPSSCIYAPHNDVGTGGEIDTRLITTQI
jgi:hypothetical protein